MTHDPATRCSRHEWYPAFAPCPGYSLAQFTGWYGKCTYTYPWEDYRVCVLCGAYGVFSHNTGKARRLNETEVRQYDLKESLLAWEQKRGEWAFVGETAERPASPQPEEGTGRTK